MGLPRQNGIHFARRRHSLRRRDGARSELELWQHAAKTISRRSDESVAGRRTARHHRRMDRRWLPLTALLFACGHANPVGPLVTTAAAIGEVAMYRVSQSGCWGQCSVGSECNKLTGLCRHIPCGGQCRSDWVCQVNREGEECIPPSLAIPISTSSGCTPLADGGSLLLVSCADGGY